MKNVLIVFMLLSLCGCGVIQEKKMSDLQARAKLEDWGVLTEADKEVNEIVLKAFIKGQLKDPGSAMYRGEAPVRMIKIIAEEPELVWYSNLYVNAKNSYGGYTGERRYILVSKCYRNAVKKCEMLGFGMPNQRYPGDISWSMR